VLQDVGGGERGREARLLRLTQVGHAALEVEDLHAAAGVGGGQKWARGVPGEGQPRAGGEVGRVAEEGLQRGGRLGAAPAAVGGIIPGGGAAGKADVADREVGLGALASLEVQFGTGREGLRGEAEGGGGWGGGWGGRGKRRGGAGNVTGGKGGAPVRFRGFRGGTLHEA
jgi:hypothetical protein